MPESHLESKTLPPYRGILAVDAVLFSVNPSAELPDLSASIPDMLETAFDRCDLSRMWLERRFTQSTGDGFIFGTEPENTPFLIHPFLDQLQIVLEDNDRALRARNRNLRLRLRVSVNLGPVPDSGDERRDRIGSPMNDTFRLLDCKALRQVLRRANPDITLMGAILSQRVFEDVVLAGYTPSLHADQLEKVSAEVPEKNFIQPGWIYVPRFSSRENGSTRYADPTPASEQGAKQQPGLSVVNGSIGQQINASRISGGIRYDVRAPGIPGGSEGKAQ